MAAQTPRGSASWLRLSPWGSLTIATLCGWKALSPEVGLALHIPVLSTPEAGLALHILRVGIRWGAPLGYSVGPGTNLSSLPLTLSLSHYGQLTFFFFFLNLSTRVGGGGAGWVARLENLALLLALWAEVEVVGGAVHRQRQ